MIAQESKVLFAREKQLLSHLKIKKHGRNDFTRGINYTNYMMSASEEMLKEFFLAVIGG
jgi:hypothetical protein